MKTLGNNSLLLFTTLLLFCSCVKDFDERTDSALKSISVVVDPSEWYDEVLELSKTSCDKLFIPLEIDDSHLLRVTGLCYNNKDSLLCACESLSESCSMIKLTFNRLLITEYCHIVVFADLVSKTKMTEVYEEEWTYLYRDDYRSLTVLSMGSTSPKSYHSLYYGYMDMVPDNQSHNVVMKKVSHNGCIRIKTQIPIRKLYGNIKYPNKFHAKTMMNITSQTLDFAVPDSFTGELVYPVTVINFGSEMSVSYSAKYKFNDVESHTYSVFNDLHQLFLLTIDCEKDALNPVEFKTF